MLQMQFSADARYHFSNNMTQQPQIVTLLIKHIHFFPIYSYLDTMFGSFLPPTTWPLRFPTFCPLPLPPLPPHFQAETVLPLSLILLKREYKQ
jgi:hypothetical protein